MKEADVKLNMVRDVRREGGYARRIEDRFSVGMPDLVFIPLSCPVVWIEAKVVRDNMFGPTARQLIELKRLRIKPHSLSYIVGWKDDCHYITWPAEQADIRDCLKQRITESIGDFIRRIVQIEALGDKAHGSA